jgi:hypothetical protein
MKSLGYLYVTLDLEGYRSGKMNDALRVVPSQQGMIPSDGRTGGD